MIHRSIRPGALGALILCLFASVMPVAAQRMTLPGHISDNVLRDSRFIGRLAANKTIPLAIGLSMRDSKGLQDFIAQAYDPSSPGFHHFLKPGEVADRFGPSAAQYEAVKAFARSQGLTVTNTFTNRLVLDVQGTSAQVEKAFAVHLNEYQATDGTRFHAPDAEPSLPAEVAPYLTAIVGLNDSVHLVPHTHLKDLGAMPMTDFIQPMTGSGSGGGYAPSDIKKAYNFTGTQTGTGQSLALFELDGYTASDITAYENAFSLTHVTLQNVLVDSATGSAGGNADEVTLDIELAVALAPGLSKIYVYEAPTTGSGEIDEYNQIASDDLASVVSTSWGTAENYLVGYSNFDLENTVFQTMAAQGQTMVAASGDRGAYDDPSSTTTLEVDDPASQPYVTSVGGTSLVTNSSTQAWSSETTWNDGSPSAGGGGGGVSIQWTKPSYQSGLGYSSTMRNVPDIALNADTLHPYAIYYNSGWKLYGGTSCAAPLWGAFFADVNQQRVTNGVGVLGFANTPLYSIGNGANYTSDFHDITSGTNLFYSASTGYDDATGWGSFNCVNLLTALIGSTVTPVAPTNLTATGGDTQVSLSWTASGGATSYNVLRSLSSGGSYSTIKTGNTTTSYTNTGLTNGTTYYFKVQAVNSAGTSSNSSQASAVPVAVPSAPAGLTATASNTQVALSWTASTNATSYNVLRSTVSGSGYASVATGVATTNYTNTGLTNFITYYYVVAAVNSAGASANSTEASATPATTPSKPTGLTATNGNAQVTLSWTATSGATSYNMFRSTNNTTFSTIKTGITTNSYTDTGLSNGTEYFYEVKALNASGTSPASDSVSGDPVAPPTAPATLTATAGNAQVALSWTSSGGGGASSYNVLRSTVSGGSYAAIKTGNTTTSYTNTGLTNGTTYYYVVQGVNASGTSANSSQASATPATTPSAPTGLAATAGSAQVALSWTASTGATSYSILRSTVSGSGYASVKTGNTTTSYTNTGLTNGTTYYFVVTATNSTGTSGNSSQASGTPNGATKVSLSSYFNLIGIYADGVTFSASSGLDSAGYAYSGALLGTSLTWNSTSFTLGAAGSSDAIACSGQSITLPSGGYSYLYLLGAGIFGNQTSQSFVVHYSDATTTTFTQSMSDWASAKTFAGESAASAMTYRNHDDGVAQSLAVNLYGYQFPLNSAKTLSSITLPSDSHAIVFAITLTGTGAAPAAPTNLAATAGNAQVSLTWTASSGATSYNVLRSTTSASGYTTIATGGVTASYTDTNAAAGVTYYYNVQAVSSAGASSNSGQASATPTAALLAPTNLTATAGSAQVSLSWTASSGATSYNVLRSTVSGSGYASVKTGNTTTSYTNTGLTNGTTYYFVVQAVNATGTSSNSSQASATPVAPPSAPTGLAGTPGNAQVALSWTASTGATSYNLLRSTVNGSGYANVVSQSGTSYTDTGLTNGLTYYYVVQAVNSAGTSGNSSQASATPVLPTESAWSGTACGGSAWAIPGTVLAVNYDCGGEGVGYHDTDTTNNGGQYRTDAVDIETCFDTGGGYDVGWTASGEYLKYMVNVAAAGNYDLSFRLAGPQSGTCHLEDTNGTNLTGTITTPNTGGYEVWQTVTVYNVTLTAGAHTLKFAEDSGGYNFNYISFASSPSVPSAPAGLTATPGNAQVALSWTASSGATSYNVLSSTTNGSGYGSVSSPTTTSYTDTGLTNGLTYYYVVQAVNTAGTSANSSQASATPVAAPSAPTGLTATPGDSQVSLIWAASTGATSYNVLRSTANGSGYGSVSSPTATNYTDTGLTNGITYYYAVQAVNAGGTSGNSSQASATPAAVPSAPTGLTATPGSGQVNLSWTASTGATGYNVLRSTTSGSGYGGIFSQTGTSYIDSGLTNGITYYYVVQAVNASGTSGNSSQASATPVAPPSAPTGLTATPGDAQVSLSWTASTGATSYNVLRSSVNGSGYSTTANPNSTNYADTGLSNGFTYYYVVQAVNTSGTSGNSSQASAIPVAVPSAPTGLTATPGNVQVALSWTASTGATSYNVLSSTVSGSGYVSVTGGVSSTSYTNTGLTNGTTYYYVVQAVNASGTSGNSNQASATPAATPSAPTGLIATAGDTQISLTWNTSSGATSYNVKRSTVSGSGYVTIASPTTTSYTNTGLTNGVTYYFVVTAVSGGGESGNSNESNAAPQTAAPSAPTGLTATAGSGQVSLSWTAATGATSYNVKRSTTNGGPYTTISSPTPASFADTGLTNGTTYYYVVTAVNGGGESAASSQASATPVAGGNAPPTVATAAHAGANPVTTTSTTLAALGADDGGEAALVYTWATTTKPAGVSAPTFSTNGTNAAKNTTVTFKGTGAYTFTVTIKDTSGLTCASSVDVTVNQTISFISVTPASASIGQGATQQFTASAKDLFGVTMSPQPTYTWTATGGTVSTGGLYTAGSTNGTFQVTATASGKTAHATVTISGAAQVLTTITVSPSSASITTGATQQDTATGLDQNGNPMSPQPTFTWTVTGGGTIDSSGLFTAGSTAGGPFTVTATSAGVSGTASITVTAPALVLTTITVSPPSASITTGATQQYTATGLDQNGNALAVQPTFTWTVTGGGTIDSSGLFTAGGTAGGPFTVTATSGGVSGTGSVTVTGAGNQALTVATPAAASPSPVTSTSAALSVLGADDGGEAALVYTWAATTIPSGAASPTFSANGTNAAKNTTVTFKKAGNYTFTVTIKDTSNLSVTSTVSVTVNQTISFISVTPTPVTVAHGATQQFTASAKDLFGVAMSPQPTFTWTATGGTVTSSGLFTAGSTTGTSFNVTAAASGKSGKATVTVN